MYREPITIATVEQLKNMAIIAQANGNPATYTLSSFHQRDTEVKAELIQTGYKDSYRGGPRYLVAEPLASVLFAGWKKSGPNSWDAYRGARTLMSIYTTFFTSTSPAVLKREVAALKAETEATRAAQLRKSSRAYLVRSMTELLETYDRSKENAKLDSSMTTRFEMIRADRDQLAAESK